MAKRGTEKMAIKKSMDKLHAFLTVAFPEVIENADYLKLVEAGKGGFNGENSFVEVDGVRVARICAMTGAVFAHDNTDKALSFFYKNGSYMIGAEVIKANARKEFDSALLTELQELEDQMMEGELSPKEWKEQVTKANATEFEFVLDDDTKAQLIEDFNGYDTKEAFTEAFLADEVAPFSDYAEQIKALRDLAKHDAEEEVA